MLSIHDIQVLGPEATMTLHEPQSNGRISVQEILADRPIQQSLIVTTLVTDVSAASTVELVRAGPACPG